MLNKILAMAIPLSLAGLILVANLSLFYPALGDVLLIYFLILFVPSWIFLQAVVPWAYMCVARVFQKKKLDGTSGMGILIIALYLNFIALCLFSDSVNFLYLFGLFSHAAFFLFFSTFDKLESLFENLSRLSQSILIASLILLALVAYPFYDGYFSRELPYDEYSKFEIVRTDIRDDKMHVLLKYSGDWMLREIEDIDIFYMNKDGFRVRTLGGYVTDQLDSRELRSGWNDDNWITVDLTDYSLKGITSGSYGQWEPVVGSAKGHRKPMRIARYPVEFFSGLFRRD